MSLPLSRAEFAEFCLRQLGKGAHNIEVTDEQIEDNIDIALQWYLDYNDEATEKVYYPHKVTAADITNKWIPMPDNIIGVVRIFPLGDALGVQNMFNIRYQIALNDLYNLTNLTLVPYFMAMQNIGLIEQMLVGQPMYRYKRHLDRCYIDIDWSKILQDEYLMLECYQVIDPNNFPQVWQDRWLIKYTTALIKKQWGNNLKKYDGMKLPGGIEFNGQKIYEEAVAELADMDKNAQLGYSFPPYDMIG